MSKLRHVVLFGFRSDTPQDRIAECIRRFVELRELVPGVEDFEWGVNVSPEGLAQGHTHAFQMNFADEGARDAYLAHPDHVAFAEMVKPLLAAVTVLDYHRRAG